MNIDIEELINNLKAFDVRTVNLQHKTPSSTYFGDASTYTVKSIKALEQQKAEIKKLEGENKELREYYKLPLELTAENGAKYLMSGEFFESVKVDCIYYQGSGEVLSMEHDEIPCIECAGVGSWNHKVPVQWTTIKDIYKKVVTHFLAQPPKEQSE